MALPFPAEDSGIFVHGSTVDNQTRCIHYHSDLDIVAIKFKCCGKFYPCYKCHNENERHPVIRWKKNEFDNRAVLCGVCKRTLSIREYMQSEKCPWCGSAFNPGCKNHFDIYFEVSPGNQCRKHAPETGA